MEKSGGGLVEKGVDGVDVSLSGANGGEGLASQHMQ